MKPSILITGASGGIGRALVSRLADDFQIYARSFDNDMRIDEYFTWDLVLYGREELAWGKSMNKSLIYLLLGGAITIFMLWDMADHFFGGLGFPRGDWETTTWGLPFLLLVLIILLQREKDNEKPLDQEDD